MLPKICVAHLGLFFTTNIYPCIIEFYFNFACNLISNSRYNNETVISHSIITKGKIMIVRLVFIKDLKIHIILIVYERNVYNVY